MNSQVVARSRRWRRGAERRFIFGNVLRESKTGGGVPHLFPKYFPRTATRLARLPGLLGSRTAAPVVVSREDGFASFGANHGDPLLASAAKDLVSPCPCSMRGFRRQRRHARRGQGSDRRARLLAQAARQGTRALKDRVGASALPAERISGHSCAPGTPPPQPWPASTWPGSPPRAATPASPRSSSTHPSAGSTPGDLQSRSRPVTGLRSLWGRGSQG